MGKIENDRQLKISRQALEGMRRALKATEKIPQPDIRKLCADSVRIGMERIEIEIEEYLTQKIEVQDREIPVEAAVPYLAS
jgi:hypothetical protein